MTFVATKTKGRQDGQRRRWLISESQHSPEAVEARINSRDIRWEADAAAGQKDLAIKNYEKSTELNRKNTAGRVPFLAALERSVDLDGSSQVAVANMVRNWALLLLHDLDVVTRIACDWYGYTAHPTCAVGT